MTLTNAQRDARAGRLFATDAAPALGLSKYKTPLQLWLEKRGEAEEAIQDPEELERLEMGHIFEPAIAKLYEARTGIPAVASKGTHVSKEHDWMGAHLDYRSPTDGRIIEIKNFAIQRRKDFGEPGSADVPNDILCQVLHQLCVTKAPMVDVAVVFGGQTFLVFSVPYDQRSIAELVDNELEFMARLQTGVPPEPINADDLMRMYPRSLGSFVHADLNTEKAAHDLSAAKAAHKQMEERIQRMEESIKLAMGPHERLVDSRGRTLATWKSDHKGEPIRKAKKGYLDTLREEYPEVWDEISEEQSPPRRFLLKV